jgi:hypothetical protein
MQGKIGRIGRNLPAGQENDELSSVIRSNAMKEMNTAAFGIFPDRMSIETVVTTLKREGFCNSDVSVLFRENRGTWEQTRPMNSIASAAAKATATTVGACHGALRWLAGLSPIAIPGRGTFVAVGPVRVALEGNASGGTHGAVAGTLVGMGVPEFQAKRYEGWLENRWFLLSVQFADSQLVTKAKRILGETLAEDVLFTDDPNGYLFNSNPGVAAIAGSGINPSHFSR